MIRHKIRAFTIMETIVAMIVSAIVISITFTVFGLVVKYYRDFELRNKGAAELLWFKTMLQKDVMKASLIEADNGEIIFRLQESTIRYEFTGTHIIRHGLKLDTLAMNNTLPDLAFLGCRSRLEATGNSSPVIDDIKFSITFKHQDLPFHFHKQYDAATLFNLSPHAFN